MIPFGDPKKSSPVRKGEVTEAEQIQRRRSEVAAQAAPSQRNDPRGHFIDFNALSTAAAKPSGMSLSSVDLYAPVVRAEDAKREETTRRMDALPSHIAALPQKQPGLGVDALEALAVIERSSKAMGHQPVAVTRGDIARAIKSTPERAEAIITDLERRSLLRRQATAGTVAYFTVHL